MKANILLAPTLALTMLTPACTEAAPDAPTGQIERVTLDHSQIPEVQAQQLEDALNAGKIVTGATVMVDYTISLWPCRIPDSPEAAFLNSPIKIGKDTYLYSKDKPNEDGLDVSVLRYDGTLEKAFPERDKKVDPHEARDVSLSGVYSQHRTEQGSDRYYAISQNQDPGHNYNDATKIGGYISWFVGNVPTPKCDSDPGTAPSSSAKAIPPLA